MPDGIFAAYVIEIYYQFCKGTWGVHASLYTLINNLDNIWTVIYGG